METGINLRPLVLLALLFLTIQGALLWHMGHPLVSVSGEVDLWHGIVKSAENSQQVSDWYTFSHIIHGFIFYCVLRFLFPKLNPGVRLLMALGIEVAWEVIENTPWLVEHYRKQALAMGYSGDSILNSVSDTIAMIIGFVIAWRMPILITIAVALFLEGTVAYSIHDNLTLNILNFIHQFDFIREWQSGS